MTRLKMTWPALYHTSILFSLKGFRLAITLGPRYVTIYKYVMTMISVGNGLSINGQSFTRGSVLKTKNIYFFETIIIGFENKTGKFGVIYLLYYFNYILKKKYIYKKNVPLMESTRFIYLSMAMFTRTDAMFHPCYLKQNKKTDYVKILIFFMVEDLILSLSRFKEIIARSWSVLWWEINVLTIVIQIINIDGERLEVVIPTSFPKFIIMFIYIDKHTIFRILLPTLKITSRLKIIY